MQYAPRAMELYVVRHGIAEERRPDRPDAERALTEKGARRFRKHAKALGRLDVRFTEVLHSPWRRAAETAKLLGRLSERPPSAVDALAAPPDERILAELAQREQGVIAVVGHRPWLNELTAWLVLGDRDDGEARFGIEKGGVVHLTGAPRPGSMQLVASMPPKLLRLAAR